MPLGSSPHTRGARARPGSPLGRQGIIPAYAGSTKPQTRNCFIQTDHPRIRGEHPHCLLLSEGGEGSSPHTRGAQDYLRHPRRGAGIIPAYAGSTAGSLCASPTLTDHPRIRGEHDPAMRLVAKQAGSSPHTRGAPVLDGTYGMSIRIIPAYAGSTGWISPGRKRCKDHPRIRGEHVRLIHLFGRRRGSSPHTRGALTA